MIAFNLTPSSLLSKNGVSLRNPSLSYQRWFYFCLFLLEQFTCRWFAQAPLGHVPGRAYRLVESSANRADFPGMPLKGLILFAFFHWLTRKRVNVFFDTHLVVRIILL